MLLTWLTEDFKTSSGFLHRPERERQLTALIILSARCNWDYFSLGDLV